MTDVKCADCAEYKNEWCEKIIDSPHPDILRDCQHWHERKDMVEVIRCQDCKHWYLDADTGMACEFTNMWQPEDGYCNWAERKKS